MDSLIPAASSVSIYISEERPEMTAVSKKSSNLKQKKMEGSGGCSGTERRSVVRVGWHSWKKADEYFMS